METTATDTPNPAKTGQHRHRSIAGQVSKAKVKIPRPIGKPTKYSIGIADTIIQRMSNGETLSLICKELNICQQSVYAWCGKHEDFAERYNDARKLQANSLVNELLDETKGLDSEKAAGMRIRADVVKWFAGKINPEYSDVRRVELKGEVTHTHIHSLTPQQKMRIAESWLMSQGQEEPALIEGEAETTGPALSGLEAVGVSESTQEPDQIIPTRKRLPTVKRQKETADNW